MTARAELRELRATIEELTGKVPASNDLVYLRKRLAMLRSERSQRDRWSESRCPTEVESPLVPIIGAERYMLVRRLAGGTVSVNDVVRRAIDEYAVKQGLGADVERAKKGKG